MEVLLRNPVSNPLLLLKEPTDPGLSVAIRLEKILNDLLQVSPETCTLLSQDLFDLSPWRRKEPTELEFFEELFL